MGSVMIAREAIPPEVRRRYKSRSCTPALASGNRRSEDVGILPIVVAELKLRDVERHIFGAHFVERAQKAALGRDSNYQTHVHGSLTGRGWGNLAGGE